MAAPQQSDDTQSRIGSILARYDTNKDMKLSKEEVQKIIEEYEDKKASLPPEVAAALQHYDKNADGKLDAKVRLRRRVGCVGGTGSFPNRSVDLCGLCRLAVYIWLCMLLEALFPTGVIHIYSMTALYFRIAGYFS